jgi:hypothetical protein
MLLTRKLAALSAFGVAAATVVISPATAHAAGGCWDAGFVRLGSEAYYCYNAAPTPVYEYSGGPQVGTLTSSLSWFTCYTDHGAYNGEANGPHPYRWLFTQADTPSGVEGWVPDSVVSSETDPLPSCF